MPIRIYNAERIRRDIEPRLAQVRDVLAAPLRRIEKLPRAQASGHPLIRALEAAERWASRPDLATVPIEGYVVEAVGLGVLIDAREADPALPELFAGMVDPNQYLHALGILGVAYALQNDLPRVEHLEIVRHDPSKHGRIPDLRVGFDGGHELAVEVKAPRILHWPRRHLTRRNAHGCVRCAIAEAADPTRSQLPRDSPGLVALASFGVEDSAVELMRVEATSFLRDRCQNEDTLMGALFVDFRRRGTLELAPYQPGPAGSLELEAGVFWSRHAVMAHNPWYRGNFNIGTVAQHEAAKVFFDLKRDGP